MIAYNNQRGFSLIELMVTVAVLGIIVAVALPVYTGYIESAREGVMRDNMETIRALEEDYRLRERRYIAGTYDPSDPDAAGGLKDRLGWEPRTGSDDITYVVSCVTVDVAPECVPGDGFKVTATHTDGTEFSKTYD